MTFKDYIRLQPLLLVTCALIVGIIVGDGLADFLPQGIVLILLCTVALCLLLIPFLKRKANLKSALIYMSVFLVGMALITDKDHKISFPFVEDVPVGYDAVVIGEPQVKGKVLRCDLALTKVDGETLSTPITLKASILRDTVSNDWRLIHLGSGLRAVSVMQPLVNYRDGNFDYVRWLHSHDFRAQTFIYFTDWQIETVSLRSISFMDRLRLKALRLRHRLVSVLNNDSEQGLASDSQDQQAAVVAAMVLGDKHAISKATKDDYSISGVSHVLALSGLHLSVIYGILTLVFGGGYRRRWLSQALILLAIWMFVILVGMGSSVMRSAFMLTVYSFCVVAGREKASVNSLCFAAIYLLVANPLALWDVGFQLSFMAVLAILVFYKHLYALLPFKGEISGVTAVNRLVRWLWGMLSVSTAAQIGTTPLVAYYFGRFSCYFLLTNIIVVPCASVIIYGALAVLLASPVKILYVVLSHALTLTASFLNTFVSWVASLPGASIEGIDISVIDVWGLYIVITVACIIWSYIRKVAPLSKLDGFRHEDRK